MTHQPFESDYLPVIPLRDLVIFPGAVTPLFVHQPESIAALESAVSRDKKLFLVCQKTSEEADVRAGDLFQVGTVAEVLQVLRVPDGAAKILVEGQYAARAVEYNTRDNFLQAFVVRNQVETQSGRGLEAQMRAALRLFEQFAELSDKIPADLLANIRARRDPMRLLDAIAHYATLKIEEKQQVLESSSLDEKYHLLMQFLESENEILELENKIAGQVKDQIGKSQREYYLNEQLKAIERELGVQNEEDPELSDLAEAIDTCGMHEEAREKAERELTRLSRMPPMSPEAVVTRTWLEWITEVPWTNMTEDKIDLVAARTILDEDHYGLRRIKERILEFLAVVKLVGQGKGSILCFVGPPGVGKTSLARSIARCMGRRFVRISLGGVRDEAEIRGHRRTYVGSLPGKMIQSLRRAGTVNPVFLLDEVDKMSSDFRGDPASALLEVLDPEQNRTFNDHYLEVDYDLSRIMFITTANTMEGIPYPLLDRMELIRLSGYTEDEKYEIARRHLLPRQREAHGLKARQVKFPKPVLMRLIIGYTREAGVRELERTLAAVCRKLAVRVVEGSKEKTTTITPELLREFLGPEKFRDNAMEKTPEIGIANGLAWTEAGGEILPVEVTLMSGKGNLMLTGKLGEVMQESAKTALSWVRSHADELGINTALLQDQDIHVHVPEGAIPKDGPSAGVTIATALTSALSRKAVRQDIVMTGEVTLRGRVLKVGGLKEKMLAARRRGIRRIIVPADNMIDIEEIPLEARKGIELFPVEMLDQVLDLTLVGRKPAKKATAGGKRKSVKRRTTNTTANGNTTQRST